ncbi:MAG TPA: hypothetical protein VF469_14305, partial [Kofleriaceae bacterium]
PRAPRMTAMVWRSRSALFGAACLVALAACQRRREAPVAARAPGEVPMARQPIAIDGELHEPDWNTLARVAAFIAEGAEARPYSQIRLLRDAETLYVGLYAADQDIRSTDAFELAIGAMALSIDARGRITPPVAGARAAADVDETIDDPRDEDEEWVLEVAIPIAAVPPGATAIHAARCDTPKDGVRRCGSWDGPLVLSSQADLHVKR